MRRLTTALAAFLLAGAGMTAATASVAAHHGADRPAVCRAVDWGSRPKARAEADTKPLTDIRVGRHDCFDRMVFDVHIPGDHPIGYRVHYVDKLYQDGSGSMIPVRTGAVLEIRVAAPSFDVEAGSARYPGRAGKPLPGVDLSGFRTFREARFGGSFEGDTQVGLVVRARLPFRVFQLGNHLVVDVAHSWRELR
ncbi:AMIN-like domain-containing (lipo)protein [Streptomyces orinoci]|uniref:AMIN-like domain-containing protein n=1 Tax=Streptomyces orinoci TaxID=67339 RepID=A0ABV3K2U3_STRON|nr:hypothetical protein [Streptomyces orinoci]